MFTASSAITLPAVGSLPETELSNIKQIATVCPMSLITWTSEPDAEISLSQRLLLELYTVE